MPEEFKTRTESKLNDTDSIKTFIDRKLKITKNNLDVIRKNDMVDCYFAFCKENSQRMKPKSTLSARLSQASIVISPTRLGNYDVNRYIKFTNDDEEDNDEIDSQDLPDIPTLSLSKINDSPGLPYDKDIVY